MKKYQIVLLSIVIILSVSVAGIITYALYFGLNQPKIAGPITHQYSMQECELTAMFPEYSPLSPSSGFIKPVGIKKIYKNENSPSTYLEDRNLKDNLIESTYFGVVFNNGQNYPSKFLELYCFKPGTFNEHFPSLGLRYYKGEYRCHQEKFTSLDISEAKKIVSWDIFNYSKVENIKHCIDNSEMTYRRIRNPGFYKSVIFEEVYIFNTDKYDYAVYLTYDTKKEELDSKEINISNQPSPKLHTIKEVKEAPVIDEFDQIVR